MAKDSTPEELTQDVLERCWKESPFNKVGSQHSFTGWQATVCAALAFNPKLQESFKESAVVLIDHYSHPMNVPRRDALKHQHRMMLYISQALNELRYPALAWSSEKGRLSDEQGIGWFLHHCSWKSRWQAFGLVAAAAVAVFVFGFTLGRIALFQAVRDVWANSQTIPETRYPAQPPASAITPIDNKSAPSDAPRINAPPKPSASEDGNSQKSDASADGKTKP